MEHKSFSLGEFKALGGDAEPGSFEAVVAVFGNVDAGGDRIQPGAFKRSLTEWTAKGRSIPVLWSHDKETPPIGVVSEAREGRDGLRVKARLFIDDNPQARAIHAAMKAGALQEFSFGYGARDYSHVMEGGRKVRVLKDLHLGEISPVFSGMNPDTRLVGVKAMVRESDQCPAGMPHAVMDGDTLMACHTTAASAQAHADAMSVGKALSDALESLNELSEETPPSEEATSDAEQSAAEEEHHDKPEPNPTGLEVGEEAMARIRALQAIKPEHLE